MALGSTEDRVVVATQAALLTKDRISFDPSSGKEDSVMEHIRTYLLRAFLSAGVVAIGPATAAQQQRPSASSVTRTDLLKRVLPAGNFRNVQASVIELGPGAAAPRHRHDVAVLAYVVEGTVENQFGGGATQIHKAGDSWWEEPGTVHDVARNASKTARARLLVVYIGEEGKAATVPIR